GGEPGRGAVRTVPMTGEMRQLMLASGAGDAGSAALNQSAAIRLYGPLDVARLRAAAAAVAGRHEALRMVVAPDGESMAILPEIDVPFTFEDISGRDPAERERTAAEWLEKEASLPFDAASGAPLFRIG